MSQTPSSSEKSLDVICLGRAAVDFYGDQIGSRLEDMSSFSKYMGGSSANIAHGSARLGLKSAMLTRVGDEHMGRFVREDALIWRLVRKISRLSLLRPAKPC